MRVLVCGDREWTNEEVMRKHLSTLGLNIILIHGDARGADRMAGRIAESYGWLVEKYPAQWDKHGRAAGPIRNQQMLVEGKPDLVVAFHNNILESKGTKDMVERARRAGITVRVYGEA